MGDDKNVRHRFTVPAADSKVNDWIEAQSNLGFSIRTLIKAFIRDYGMQDATCLEFGESVKRMGRPPKKAQIHMGQMLNGTPYEEADADSEQVQDDDGTVQDGYYQNYGTSAAEAVPKAAETVKVPETDVYERQGSRNGREVHKELPPVRQTRSTDSQNAPADGIMSFMVNGTGTHAAPQSSDGGDDDMLSSLL